MKVDDRFFARGARADEAAVLRYIQRRHGPESAADFFGLGDGEASLARFVSHWQAQGLGDAALLDRVVARIVEGRLHPLQSLRISRLLHDPSEEIEPEDREALIAQVLDLDWPQAVPGGTA